MCSCHSILECCVTFSGVKLSVRSFVLFIKKKNKLSGITEMIINSNELDDTNNLEDGRPSNALLIYHVTDDDDKDFTRFEPHSTRNLKIVGLLP